jgi:hypothetical protein
MRLCLCLLTFALLTPLSPAYAQVSGLERVYGERVAMRALDQRCNFFQNGPRRALGGFTAQARGAALRAGSSAQDLSLIAQQARAAMAQKSCSDPAIRAEADRVIAAHKGWRAQMRAEYKGQVRVWHVDRTGLDAWRAWQDLGKGVRAGFVLQDGQLAFAVEVPDESAASARLYLRDPSKLRPPPAGQSLQPPLRIGTITHVAANKRPADTRTRIGTPARAGTMLIFSNTTTRATLNGDPRDSFEVEITSRSGQATHAIVEIGDIVAAYAFAAEF